MLCHEVLRLCGTCDSSEGGECGPTGHATTSQHHHRLLEGMVSFLEIWHQPGQMLHYPWTQDVFFCLGGGLSSIHRLGHLSLNLSVSCHNTSIFLHAGKWFVVCLFLIHAFGPIDFMLLHSTSGSRHFHPEAGAGCDLCPGGRSQHQEYDEGRGHPTKIRWNVWIKKGNRMWLRFLGLIFLFLMFWSCSLM